MTYQIPYNGNLEWLQERTVLFVRHGSHAYGTNVEGSDEDFKGVCVPPAEYFHGYLKHFEQAESKSPDMVIYDIRKFCKLAADCNPSIIEVLWVDEADVLVTHDWFVKCDLRINRELFISKKCRFTFSGYAMAQLKRIKLHRQYLLNPPKGAPTRSEFGLPESTFIPSDQLTAVNSAIKKKLEEWQLSAMDDLDEAVKIAVRHKMAAILEDVANSSSQLHNEAARAIGCDDNFIRMLDLERRYTSKLRDWHKYLEWKTNRNTDRAELEAKFGFDTKHGAHLVRLMRMCREILETGKVLVKRPDADELKAIRVDGIWTYDQLIEWAEKQDAELEQVYASSKLPHSPDRNAIDRLCVDIVESML